MIKARMAANCAAGAADVKLTVGFRVSRPVPGVSLFIHG